MSSLHAFLLAIVQGITEFLPISSSAHLVLLPIIMQWQDQGVVLDIAAHLGSLLAVVFYFREDLRKLISSWCGSFFPSNKNNEDAKLAWLLFWATLPIMIIALLLQSYLIEYVRNAIVIAVASIFFGLLLWLADWRGQQTRTTKQLTIFDAMFIGFAQAVALIPGTSRSGITMTAALWLGLTRVEAARFSFLLAIPTILAASLYGIYRAVLQDEVFQWSLALVVIACSAVVAWLCIHWFIKFVSKIGMMPFVLYRVLLGIVLLYFYL